MRRRNQRNQQRRKRYDELRNLGKAFNPFTCLLVCGIKITRLHVVQIFQFAPPSNILLCAGLPLA